MQDLGGSIKDLIAGLNKRGNNGTIPISCITANECLFILKHTQEHGLALTEEEMKLIVRLQAPMGIFEEDVSAIAQAIVSKQKEPR